MSPCYFSSIFTQKQRSSPVSGVIFCFPAHIVTGSRENDFFGMGVLPYPPQMTCFAAESIWKFSCEGQSNLAHASPSSW